MSAQIDMILKKYKLLIASMLWSLILKGSISFTINVFSSFLLSLMMDNYWPFHGLYCYTHSIWCRNHLVLINTLPEALKRIHLRQCSVLNLDTFKTQFLKFLDTASYSINGLMFRVILVEIWRLSMKKIFATFLNNDPRWPLGGHRPVCGSIK